MDVSKEGRDNYPYDLEEDEIPGNVFYSKRLLEGINIKDLCDGKEILFELDKEFKKYNSEGEEDNLDEIIHYDPKSLREKRGAPPLSCSFEKLASEMVNVTEDGLVKKQLVTSGVGHVVPDHAYVTVHYNLYKRNCELPFDSTYLRGRPEKFRLDQGETIVGMELAIKTMKRNENSCFFIKWEVAFGALGCPDRIEEKCDIVADITLMNFVEISNEQDLNALTKGELNKIDFHKSLNEAKKFLCNGRDMFLKKDTQQAVYMYKKCLRILNSLRLASEEEEETMLKQKVKCLVNLAICYNLLGKSEQACLMCQEVLSIDRNNVKAYFHYGRANLVLSNFKMAQRLLTKADELKPNDRDINMELKKLNDKKALFEMNDKSFWKKAFEGKENRKEEEYEAEEESCLETFEKSLRESLLDSIEEKKAFVLTGPLLDEERKVCEKLAEDLNLQFDQQEHYNLFKIKEKE